MKLGDLWIRLGLKKDGFEASMKEAKASTKSFGTSVTKYLSGVAGKFAAVTVAVKAFSTAAKNIAAFERANASLASVLGKTTKEIKGLTESAKQLGRTTEFTASNVTELQTALARLGFNEGQIASMQESVLKFASAVGTDLASAADFTGSSLRAFGLEATDTGKLLDIMAAATSNSALDFSKLQTSISIVAPIAKSFGLSVNETASFLGVLANNGYDASSAATALRNIILNLADSNGKLAKGIGHSAKSFEEIISSFRELQKKGVDVNAVLQMTDKRAAGAAVALISNADACQQLNEKLSESNGSLDDMYATMTDNVIGAVRQVKSAWEGLTLAFEESKGPMKWCLNALADLINRTTDMINAGSISGGTYKHHVQTLEAYEKNNAKNYATAEDYQEVVNRRAKQYADAKTAYDQAPWLNRRFGAVRTNYITSAAAYEAARNTQANLPSAGLFGSGATGNTTGDKDASTSPISAFDANAQKEAEEEQARERKHIEHIKQSTMTETELLAKKYEEHLALYRKHGEDTSALAEQFIKDLADNLTLEADKTDQSEQFLTAEERVKKHYEKLKSLAEKYGLDTAMLTDKYNTMLVQASSEEATLLHAEELEIAETTSQMLEDFNRLNGVNLDPVTQELLKLANATVAAVDAAETQERRAKGVIMDFNNAVIDGFVDAMQTAMGQLFKLQDVNAGAIFQALLDPLADMAIQAGSIIAAEGLATMAANSALKTFGETGWGAVIAGGALIAAGAAAKAGLSALAQGATATGTVSTAETASTSGSNISGSVQDLQLTVDINGTLKGSDIVLAAERTQTNWRR